ncbi:MAG TPA: cell division protein ZapE [Candidatus Binatia bacterium]|nr:cell division protein ZapE [Candidatus Binatia bacterium]
MTPGPRERYERALARGGFATDAAQRLAVDALQRVHDELCARKPKWGLRRRAWPAVRGLYLWGGVGRGKTWLVDAFHETLPFSRKRRTHFHRFMLDVHERRRKHAHEQDPIAGVARDLARELRVLCFDEFFVADIADAMILGRLMETLFAEGVTLVATSNIPPDRLYREGLQRDRFLPAIALLQQHCEVLHLDSPTDYRLRHLTAAEIYHSPSDAQAEANLARWFEQLGGQGTKGKLQVEGRAVTARRHAEGVAWFDFHELCETARSAADYIELARTHHTILLSRVPRLTPDREDAARRFITLVDEFYDRGVKLILAAEVPRERLYAGQRLTAEFQRTVSRLAEMQSQEYLAAPHKAD